MQQTGTVEEQIEYLETITGSLLGDIHDYKYGYSDSLDELCKNVKAHIKSLQSAVKLLKQTGDA